MPPVRSSLVHAGFPPMPQMGYMRELGSKWRHHTEVYGLFLRGGFPAPVYTPEATHPAPTIIDRYAGRCVFVPSRCGKEGCLWAKWYENRGSTTLVSGQVLFQQSMHIGKT